MQNDAFDLAFARHVRQIGLVSQEQIASALEAQSRTIQKGSTISFSDVLVQMDVITPTQKETLEKKVREQQAGVHQLGAYRLLKKLGEGGMGAVYLAQDPPTGKNVAIKVLPRHYGSNAEFVKRFRREAETAIKLRHPNIVGAFAIGEDLGYHFYVMEFCDGEPLDSLIKRERPVLIPRALNIIHQAARGLEYAHRQGVLHRDIKPSNLFVTSEGTTRILDLGLSKMVDDPGASFKTVTGAVLGTPHYISPEQAKGEKEIDGRTDIYSLGATFYHLLTGQTPFDGATVLEILSKQVNTKLPNPQDLREEVSDPIVRVLERMMAKRPADRYPDCGTLIVDLEEVLAGREPKSQMISEGLSIIAPAARRSSMPKRRSPSSTRRVPIVKAASKTPWMVAGGVAVAALVVLGMVLVGKGNDRSDEDLPARKPAPVVPKGPPLAHSHDVQPPKPAPPPARPKPDDPFEIAPPAPRPPPPPPPPEKAESPIEALVRQIKEANPSLDGPIVPELQDGEPVGITFSAIGVTDLRPLASLKKLRQLDVSGYWDESEQQEHRSQLADIGPLRGLPLEVLRLHHTQVSNIEALRGMPLRSLSLSSTPLRDASPLRGMKLTDVDLSWTGITDLSVLRGMPIESVFLSKLPLDLTLLKTLPLKSIRYDFRPEQDLTALAGIPTLEYVNGVRAEEFLKKTPLAPLLPMTDEAWKSAVHLLPLVVPEKDAVQGAWKIAEGGLQCDEPTGGPMNLLLLPYRPPEEYALRVVFTPEGDKPDVSQILSRGGKAFQWINGGYGNTLLGFAMIDETEADVSPVAIRRPVALAPRRTATAIIEVRKDAVLAYVNGERLSLLRPSEHRFKLPTLVKDPDETRLGLQTYQCGATFYAADVMELKGKGTLLRTSRPPAPMTSEEALWKNAVDLMALVEPSRDAILGVWRKENGRLVSEPQNDGTCRLPYEPPAEYDFRIIFTRKRGGCATAQFFSREGRNGFFELGGYGNQTMGFGAVNGVGSDKNPTGSRFACKDGVRYVSTLQVRRDRVTAYLDGKKVSEWLPSMGTFSTEGEWSMDVPNILGLANCDAYTVFDAIQVREVTGKGRIRGTFATPVDPVSVKAISSTTGNDQAQRVIAKIRDLNPAFDPLLARTKIENERLTELAIPTQRVFDVWPIRGLTSLRKLDVGDEQSSSLSDISCLKGMKLQELSLANTRITDFSALQGMPLVRLQLRGSAIKELSALKGLRLTWLGISNTAISDLGPLKDIPLQKLDCDQTGVTDWSPLKGHRTLKTVNDLPLADFLKSR
jgi:serine/threonine-protein kinase